MDDQQGEPTSSPTTTPTTVQTGREESLFEKWEDLRSAIGQVPLRTVLKQLGSFALDVVDRTCDLFDDRPEDDDWVVVDSIDTNWSIVSHD